MLSILRRDTIQAQRHDRRQLWMHGDVATGGVEGHADEEPLRHEAPSFGRAGSCVRYRARSSNGQASAHACLRGLAAHVSTQNNSGLSKDLLATLRQVERAVNRPAPRREGNPDVPPDEFVREPHGGAQ